MVVSDRYKCVISEVCAMNVLGKLDYMFYHVYIYIMVI